MTNANSISPNELLDSSLEAECVYLVDDCLVARQRIHSLCEQAGMRVQAYVRPSEFLIKGSSFPHGCLVAKLLLPEMSGLDLHREISELGFQLTTILMSSNSDAMSCRAAFLAGVFDFIEHEARTSDVLSAVRRALAHNRLAVANCRQRAEHWNRIDALTARELEVAELLSSGKALKEIGSQLNISVQTASKHRTSIYEKLLVTNEVDLYKVFVDCAELLDETRTILLHSGDVTSSRQLTSNAKPT